MKNICRLAILAVLAFQTSACHKNNDNQGQTTALAPMTIQSCTAQQAYSPYGGNVPYYNQAQAGFCGCAYGEVPACNPGVGMACVPAQANSNYAVYSYNGGNFGFNTYGGYNRFYGGYSGAYGNAYGGGYGNNCSTGIGQICQIGVVGSCGYGQCIQAGPGAPYGICANY